MRSKAEPHFLLLWKGRESGPFSTAAIREKLEAGEISRMHQVHFKGKWMVLDEFLQKHGGGDPDAQRRAEAEKRAAKGRGGLENRTGAEHVFQNGREDSFEDGNRFPLAQLLPQPPAAALPPSDGERLLPGEPPRRTSRLAIAALLLSLGNFVPYVNFVAWIFALGLGHAALRQMKRDPELGGQWLALAGLLITYFLLVMGLTFVLLMFGKSQHYY